MLDRIQWLGHGSFLLQTCPSVYINPWRVARTEQPADVILISDDHYEHCSPPDVQKLRSANTLVIGSARAAAQIEGCTILRPWQSTTIGRACIKAVPAYNPADPATKTQGKLGFIISLNYYDIYYAGSTHRIPEMETLRPDIAILPIDGRDRLDSREAVSVVQQMRPRWVIPSSWGSSISGLTRVDAQVFAREVGDAAEVVLPGQQSRV